MENSKLLYVEIVTPQRIFFQGQAISVTVPGAKSPFQILNMHAPIVSTLETGITKIMDEYEKPHYFATGSGFTEVHKNKVSILVENASDASELDLSTVQKELNDAKEALKNTNDKEHILNKILEAENKLKAIDKLK